MSQMPYTNKCVGKRAATCMEYDLMSSSHKKCIESIPCDSDLYNNDYRNGGGDENPNWRDVPNPNSPSFTVKTSKQKAFDAAPILIGGYLIYYGSRSPKNVNTSLAIGGILLLPILTGDLFFYHRLFKMGG